MKIAALISDIPFLCLGEKVSEDEKKRVSDMLQSGDIILVTDKLLPIWRITLRLLFSAKYCHSAIYVGGGSVIEATTFNLSEGGVVYSDVDSILNGYKSFCIVRPPFLSEDGRGKSIEYALSQLGKPYDYSISIDDTDSSYCSRLVAESLIEGGIEIRPVRCMGREGYVPDQFMSTEGMKVIYRREGRKRSSVTFLIMAALFASALFFPTSLFLLLPLLIGGGFWQYRATRSYTGYKRKHPGVYKREQYNNVTI